MRFICGPLSTTLVVADAVDRKKQFQLDFSKHSVRWLGHKQMQCRFGSHAEEMARSRRDWHGELQKQTDEVLESFK